MSQKKRTVRQIMDLVNQTSEKKYAYTTIHTILQRLEKDVIVSSTETSINKTKQRFYHIRKNAYKQEITKTLRNLYIKFGPVGIKHLSNILDTNIEDLDFEEIEKKLEL